MVLTALVPPTLATVVEDLPPAFEVPPEPPFAPPVPATIVVLPVTVVPPVEGLPPVLTVPPELARVPPVAAITVVPPLVAPPADDLR